MTCSKLMKMTMAAVIAAPLTFAATTEANREATELAKKVRHELVMLPFYGVFDNMTFRIEDGVVTLSGQVTRPTLKSSAGNVVRKIEGVRAVRNEMEVLPLSPFDNGIRLRALRAIYRQPALQRYGWGVIPGIHIIVKNGELTLEGVVANQTDSNIANIVANGVFGAFKVVNNLKVEKKS